MDGEASGRIKCTLANWTGVAYKIPRTALDLCKEHDDLKQAAFTFYLVRPTRPATLYILIRQAPKKWRWLALPLNGT
jgi:hypothetical protein